MHTFSIKIKQLSRYLMLCFGVIFWFSCSKSDDDPIDLNYESAIIETITISALNDYEKWDEPGKPDLYFELILEPSTFVTTSMLIENADLPAVWDQEITLPGEKDAEFFLRFTDLDTGSSNDQIFAVTLRPSKAYPQTRLVFDEGGNEMEIILRFE